MKSFDSIESERPVAVQPAGIGVNFTRDSTTLQTTPRQPVLTRGLFAAPRRTVRGIAPGLSVSYMRALWMWLSSRSR